jgi:hypothetical protein
MVEVNGLDRRDTQREVQKIAFEEGAIPKILPTEIRVRLWLKL